MRIIIENGLTLTPFTIKPDGRRQYGQTLHPRYQGNHTGEVIELLSAVVSVFILIAIGAWIGSYLIVGF